MTSTTPLRYSIVLAGLLLTLGITGCAQSGAAPMGSTAQGSAMHGERMGRHDPAKMRAYMAERTERVAKRQAEFKAKLQITPAQEAAWSAFAATMQPMAWQGQGRQGPGPQDMSQMTAPQRLDAMRAMRTQRMTEMNTRMDQRDSAVKALYAVLTPEQRKVFDAETLPKRGGHHAGMGGGKGGGMGGGMGGGHGYHHGRY
jgi:protein CpxP